MPCRYQYEVGRLLKDEALQEDFDAAITGSEPEQVWSSLARVSVDAAERISSISNPQTQRNLALCFAVQAAAHRRYPAREQERIAKNVLAALETRVRSGGAKA